MADWLKGFDPLKGVDLFGTKSIEKTVDSMATGWKIGTEITKTVASHRARKKMEEDAARERERLREALENPPEIHGSAKWATASDVNLAGLLRPLSSFDTPSSILLGTFPDPELNDRIGGQIHWDGEGHLITVAPTRSGKSTTTIVPNLLRYRGSCIVLDPKGELYRDTAGWRSTLGPVYRIAPFGRQTDGFNPLSVIETFSDARALASLLMPPDPKAQNFFRNDAIAFLTALIMFVVKVAPPHRRTMQEIRDITAGPLADMEQIAEDMARTGISAIANPANTMLGKRREALSTLRDTFNSELSVWDDPGIGEATRDGVDFKTLKDRTTTVYISVPFDKMDAYGSFLKVVLASALDAMLRNERQPDIPVLFVLDEFLSLGPFPQFRDAIRTHAGAGVRLWFFLQDLSTLEEHYPSSWKTFLNSAVKMFFGTNDAFTGRLVSETILGNATVAHLSGGVSASGSTTGTEIFDKSTTRGHSINANVQFTQRPLLTPTEVVSLLSATNADQTRAGILSISQLPRPLKVRLVPWFLGETCKSRAGLPSR
ncbi:type IV secretory system conjugative DNA transfer family protein (plasmid) [Peteryoungia desertarenae]|uniref:Type IV secretory system conjugative DNA transfer family protein n=1 Tax=Peteryoungia desertarenae TaxID=1813451 RepID=A0ABX6QUH4_9HYPH|nr:type IV secretory system conjugative DNA transfer family protein [Peteryoungia desertarenae]QLF72057.1 type IV secretory system conjugative DNA transfer family protein [Peteryoungia desertarenae]